MKGILVTGIGGVVGQGIARNLQRLRKINHSFGYNIIGTDISEVSAGNHLCHDVYKVPYAYSPFYIPTVLDICKECKINLIIPSTDYEAYYLSKYKDQFDCEIAVSGSKATYMSLDKYENYKAFRSKKIPFAESVLPSEYTYFDKYVVKPREGRGSRDIYYNPDNVCNFSDNFVVQKELEGQELTTAFYVTRLNKLHGMITFLRELEQGCTVKAEIIKDYDKEICRIIKKMITHFDYRGSINIQMKATKKGVIPFEINCRISGTNSIRARFGFNDILYTIEEYLLGHFPSAVDIKQGCAIRVMMDVIYPMNKLADIKNMNDKYYIS